MRTHAWASHLCALLVAFASTAITAAHAQADPRTTAALIAAERTAADASIPLHERECAADRASELRRRLIAETPESDDRLPAWLADQGASLLARLARDGSDTALLFGIPLPMQREAATGAATEAAAFLRRARSLIADSPDAEHDRTVRIPFFLARAELLLAAAATGDERRRRAEAAHELIGGITLSEIGPESVRRINISAALLLRSSDPTDAGIALDELAWVLTREGDEAKSIPALARAEAWMGLLHASTSLGRAETLLNRFGEALAGPPFTTGDTTDALLTVLAYDAATRALFEHGIRTGDTDYLHRAIRQQAGLLARTDLPMRAEALRPLVYEKLAALARAAPADIELPGAMRTARAVILARQEDYRGKAIAILREVAREADADVFAPDALWELAVLLTQPPHADGAMRMEAAQALTRLAERHPDSPRAPEAIAAALNFARALDAATIDLGAARKTYAHALNIAATTFPDLPEIDIWRYERARLLLEDHQRSPDDTGDPASAAAPLRAALDQLQLIPAASSLAADAARLAEHIHLARLDAMHAELRARRRAGAPVEQFARDTIAPAARQAAAWARTNNSPFLDRFRLDLAEALIEAAATPPHAGIAGARQTLEEILPRIQKESPHLLPRATLAHARTLIASADPAAAFPLLRNIVQQLEPHITTNEMREADDETHELFWHAWTLMLETLAHQERSPAIPARPPHTTARSTDPAALRIHIRRLQTIDPTLGGPPWRARILALHPND